jgi:hypothetical protein
MRTRYKMVLVVVVVGVSVLWACRGSRGGTVEDSNDFRSSLPCWEQSWECGRWVTSESYPKTEDAVYIFTADDKPLLMSVCEWCNSIRVVEAQNKIERIVLSPKGQKERCRHKWIAGLHNWSFEPVRSGDALFIIYNNQMYVVKVRQVIWHEQKVICDLAKVADPNGILTTVNLGNLTWQKLEAIREISICNHTIAFFTPFDDDDMNGSITIHYDRYYGCSYGPEASQDSQNAHIAIVQRAYLETNSVVDLTKFRFKTWEDGLGNRCGETTASDESVLNKQEVFLGLHDGPIRDIAAAPDGSFIATTAVDGQAIINYLELPLKKVIGPFNHIKAFTALTVSRCGTSILAAGEAYGGFPRIVLRFDTTDGRYEEIKIPFDGSIMSFSYYNNDKHIAYITADNKLSFFDLEAQKLVSSHHIFGGFIHSIAVSPKQDFFAIISMNEIEYKNAEPCKLTIFDQKGTQTLSYQFESCRGTYYSKMVFLGSEHLALCLPTGEMWQWKWLPDDRKWKIDKKVRITSGLFSAIESSADGKTIWLAKENSVIAIDSGSGQTLDETTFDIGEIKSNFLTPAITVIEIVPQRQTLAVGLGDGRVALMSIPKK